MASFDPQKDLVVVIMAGGAGTRFWPASTEERPKQFLRFFGDRSLYQQAVDRFPNYEPYARRLAYSLQQAEIHKVVNPAEVCQ